VSPSFSAGSWGYVNPSAVVSWGNSRASVLGGYSYRAADPYRDGSGALFTTYANYRPDAMNTQSFDIDTGWGRAYFSPSAGHSVQAAYTRQQADHVLYPYLLMDGLADDADRLNVSYAAARDGARFKAISARAYYSAVEHWMTDALRVSSAGAAREYSMATEANTATTGGNVEVVIGGATAGVEAFRREWDATTALAGSKYAPQYSIPSWRRTTSASSRTTKAGSGTARHWLPGDGSTIRTPRRMRQRRTRTSTSRTTGRGPWRPRTREPRARSA